MLQKIKQLLGLADTSKDELLLVLIEQCQEEAINYTHNSDISTLNNCICSMVVYRYNLLGTEGLQSESYSGVNFSYSSDYPDTIMRQLKAHRKLIVW